MEPPVSVPSAATREARGNCCCGAAAGAAGDAVGRFRIAHGAEGRVFVGAAHGEFVAVGFAEDDGAGGFEAGDGGGVVGRDVVLEDFRPAGGRRAAGADGVFDGDGDASHGRERFSRGDQRVDFVGLGVGAVLREGQEGVQLGIAGVDSFVVFSGEFTRRDFFRDDRFLGAPDGPV